MEKDAKYFPPSGGEGSPGGGASGIRVPRETLTKAELKERDAIDEELRREAARINQKRQKKRITQNELKKMGLSTKIKTLGSLCSGIKNNSQSKKETAQEPPLKIARNQKAKHKVLGQQGDPPHRNRLRFLNAQAIGQRFVHQSHLLCVQRTQQPFQLDR